MYIASNKLNSYWAIGAATATAGTIKTISIAKQDKANGEVSDIRIYVSNSAAVSCQVGGLLSSVYSGYLFFKDLPKMIASGKQMLQCVRQMFGGNSGGYALALVGGNELLLPGILSSAEITALVQSGKNLLTTGTGAYMFAEGKSASGGSGPSSSGGNGGDKPTLISSIDKDQQLVKAAQEMGKNERIQKEANHLINELLRGNQNPGLGSKNLFKDICYLRGRNGARVFYRRTATGYEILGKADKSNEQIVINILQKLYK